MAAICSALNVCHVAQEWEGVGWVDQRVSIARTALQTLQDASSLQPTEGIAPSMLSIVQVAADACKQAPQRLRESGQVGLAASSCKIHHTVQSNAILLNVASKPVDTSKHLQACSDWCVKGLQCLVSLLIIDLVSVWGRLAT